MRACMYMSKIDLKIIWNFVRWIVKIVFRNIIYENAKRKNVLNGKKNLREV